MLSHLKLQEASDNRVKVFLKYKIRKSENAILDVILTDKKFFYFSHAAEAKRSNCCHGGSKITTGIWTVNNPVSSRRGPPTQCLSFFGPTSTFKRMNGFN